MKTVAITDVRHEEKTVRVYNLEVENAHTFFVGEEGVLVHNYIPPPRGPLPGFPGSVLKGNKGGRQTWETKKYICQWDSDHGNVEVFNKGDKEHLGGYNPNTGERSPGKPGRAVPGRRPSGY